MGNSLPDISIEWDEAHAKALGPELCAYRRIVNRLGAREGVVTSFGAEEQSDAPDLPSDGSGEQSSGAAGLDADAQDDGILGDIRAMRRSLNRLRELGAQVTINGRPADSVALDNYEDTLCREVRELGLDADDDDISEANRWGCCGGGGFLSSIITFVGLVVILRWLFG